MYNTVKDLFVGICDSIRAKKGTTELIEHQNIPNEIVTVCDKSYAEGYDKGIEEVKDLETILASI